MVLESRFYGTVRLSGRYPICGFYAESQKHVRSYPEIPARGEHPPAIGEKRLELIPEPCHIHVVKDGNEVGNDNAHNQFFERAGDPDDPEGASRPCRQREVTQYNGVERRYDQACAENRSKDTDVRRVALLALLPAAKIDERFRADVEQSEQGGALQTRVMKLM